MNDESRELYIALHAEIARNNAQIMADTMKPLLDAFLAASGGQQPSMTVEEAAEEAESARAKHHQNMRLNFAAAALHVVHADGGRYGADGLKMVADQCFALADAMIAASAPSKARDYE